MNTASLPRVAPSVELKKIKLAKFASHETFCFDAEVWIDGKKAGSVSNDGQGGSNHFLPRGLEEQLSALVQGQKDGKLDLDAELFVGLILERFELAKQTDRTLKTRFVFTVAVKRGVFQTRAMKPEQIVTYTKLGETQLRTIIKDADRILNLMPLDAALDLLQAEAAVKS
jgi:hypothetical protein